MNSMPESARDRLLALAQRWGQPEIFGANFVAIIDALKKQVTDAGLGEDQRGAAAKRLIALDAKIDNARLVIEQISLLSTPSLGAALLNALTDSRDRDTGKAVVAGWEHYTPGIRKTAVGVLMRRPDWTRALLDAVEKKVVGRTDLATEQWSQLKQNPNREIAGRAGRLSSATGVAVSADREEVVKKLLPLAKEHGTPARGKEVFTANCAACHTFNGQGGKVGPDLSGIGAKDRSEILTDILDPNRSVEANYRLWNLTTKDGEVLSGRLDTETQTSVEILDTTGQKHPIQRSKIATLESSQQSIMPTGFESIPPDDIKSLLDYLGQAHL
jgi:putative heme-binding domain-containing protein